MIMTAAATTQSGNLAKSATVRPRRFDMRALVLELGTCISGLAALANLGISGFLNDVQDAQGELSNPKLFAAVNGFRTDQIAANAYRGLRLPGTRLSVWRATPDRRDAHYRST